MAENRINRENSTRTKQARKKAWVRAETLPTPEAEDGYTYRWIRVSMQGKNDPTNVSSKLREGWEPVKAEDHPQFHVLDDSVPERYKDNVIQGGLMLCKAPVELAQERNQYFADQANSQMRSVDNNLMRESDSRMPIFNDRKTQVRFGEG